MTRIKRIHVEGYPYFITSNTQRRRKIPIDNYDLMKQAIERAKLKAAFEFIAWVMLPDHFHFLIDTKGQNISDLIQRIKLSFSIEYIKRHPTENVVWQKSFWDHIIRNEADLIRHLHYIHLNPVKHGYVINPFDYPYSSILEYKDLYGDGLEKDSINKIEGDFGE